MPVAPIPAPLDHLGVRPFCFYPPILNIEHNEWLYSKSTWSEMLVSNARTGMEIWIPRRFLGEISSVEDPVVIVGLVKELEYRAGSIWPHQRRVIEMPAAPASNVERLPAADLPAPIVGIRLERSEAAIGRLIGIVMVVAILAYVLMISTTRDGGFRLRAVMQSDTGLTARDDYFTVVRRLGNPAEDRWSPETGALQYRALLYPQQGYYVILLGADRKQMRYIGTLSKDWKTIHSVPAPGMAAMLSRLQKF
ncbi:MAG: hypothetical protein EXQ52_14515 [Bryobacterales bacterium]|nr:hypothetical protein [Bryobacterales bacterium]